MARIGRPPRPDLDREQIERMALAGRTISEIAAAFAKPGRACCKSIIRRRLRAWGIKPRRGRARWCPAMTARLREMADGVRPASVISRTLAAEFRMPVSEAVVKLHARQDGLPMRRGGYTAPADIARMEAALGFVRVPYELHCDDSPGAGIWADCLLLDAPRAQEAA